jgi:uridine kinase
MRASGSRPDLLCRTAAAIDALPVAGTVLVAVDGFDGAGKTTFADELGVHLRELGRPIIRGSVDAFHCPRDVRYRRGRQSPEGFYRDSYNYDLLRQCLLDPLGPGGTGGYRTAAFDWETDRPIAAPEATAPDRAVLVFDGIFLHRPELVAYWNYSIFLRVGFGTSIPRCAQRHPWLSPDPGAESNRRYVLGQRLYVRECEPEKRATIVVDNEDLEAPYVVGRPGRARLT